MSAADASPGRANASVTRPSVVSSPAPRFSAASSRLVSMLPSTLASRMYACGKNVNTCAATIPWKP